MPVISRFLGIIISMFWKDHLPPHFHAKYGEYEITVEIDSGIIDGKFPPRALKHVMGNRLDPPEKHPYIPLAVESDLFSCRRGLGRAARASPRLRILQSGQFQPCKE